MPHPIEEKGTQILIKHLQQKGYKVEKSDRKTFDLKVDGRYAEIKTKNCDLKKLDFLSLSNRQYNEALKDDFDIYLVCGLVNAPKIYKIPAKKLLKQRTRKVISYEFDKTVVMDLLEELY